MKPLLIFLVTLISSGYFAAPLFAESLRTISTKASGLLQDGQPGSGKRCQDFVTRVTSDLVGEREEIGLAVDRRST